MADSGLAIAPMLRRRVLQLWYRAIGAALAGSLGSPLVRLCPAHAASAIRPPPGRALRWVAFYGQTTDEDVLSTYDLVVLDPMFLGSIERVARQGSRICGYLSLGEARSTDPVFGRIPPRILLEENQAWPGTWRLDVRNPAWRDLVVGAVIPAIAAKGFTGLLLDTLDTPPYLEQVDPTRYRGMRQAAIDLVRAVRLARPEMTILINRGYAILPDVVNEVDAVLAESLLSMPLADGSGYRWNSATEVQVQLACLAPAKKAPSPVPVLSLDYWQPNDPASIRAIYRRQRVLNHHPYVTTPLLSEITLEPVPDRSGSLGVES
jgi:polysaccharide biosynthesis protein PelA